MEFKEVVETLERDIGRKIDPVERTMMLYAYFEGGKQCIADFNNNLTQARADINKI